MRTRCLFTFCKWWRHIRKTTSWIWWPIGRTTAAATVLRWAFRITLLKNNNKSQHNISSVKPDDCILIWRHWWRNCPRITNTVKRPSNFNFSAFRAVIYQNLLCRRLCIVVRSWKLLSVNIVKYRCISPLNTFLTQFSYRYNEVFSSYPMQKYSHVSKTDLVTKNLWHNFGNILWTHLEKSKLKDGTSITLKQIFKTCLQFTFTWQNSQMKAHNYSKTTKQLRSISCTICTWFIQNIL